MSDSSLTNLVVRLRAEYQRTGAYAPEATCKHGIHPYDCRQGCAPPTFEAADEIERLKTANAQMLEHGREMWADVERLRAALAGMIEGVRSIEVSGDDWQEHIGDRLARAYKAVGPGLLPQEIAALEGAQDEPTSNPYKAGYLDALESARQVLEVQKNAVRGIEDFQPPVRTSVHPDPMAHTRVPEQPQDTDQNHHD